jgi:hypothetical protein
VVVSVLVVVGVWLWVFVGVVVWVLMLVLFLKSSGRTAACFCLLFLKKRKRWCSAQVVVLDLSDISSSPPFFFQQVNKIIIRHRIRTEYKIAYPYLYNSRPRSVRIGKHHNPSTMYLKPEDPDLPTFHFNPVINPIPAPKRDFVRCSWHVVDGSHPSLWWLDVFE